MKVLVEDLLLLARLDETRPVERAPVDLAVLAADACSDAIAVDPERPVALDVPEPVVVAGDQDHLRQAIANLGEQRVATHARRQPDRGPRAPRQRIRGGHRAGSRPRPRAGRAGARVRPVLAGRHRARGVGVGLGLSIVAGIAAEHGGTARAANPADGGALFTLELPIDAPGANAPIGC